MSPNFIACLVTDAAQLKLLRSGVQRELSFCRCTTRGRQIFHILHISPLTKWVILWLYICWASCLMFCELQIIWLCSSVNQWRSTPERFRFSTARHDAPHWIQYSWGIIPLANNKPITVRTNKTPQFNDPLIHPEPSHHYCLTQMDFMVYVWLNGQMFIINNLFCSFHWEHITKTLPVHVLHSVFWMDVFQLGPY